MRVMKDVRKIRSRDRVGDKVDSEQYRMGEREVEHRQMRLVGLMRVLSWKGGSGMFFM